MTSSKPHLHADYADAFATHKQLSKLIAKKKQHIKETDPEFKRMETAVNKASRPKTITSFPRNPISPISKRKGFQGNGMPLNLVRSAHNSKLPVTNNSPPSWPKPPGFRPPSKPAFLKLSKALTPQSKSVRQNANHSTTMPSSRPATERSSTLARHIKDYEQKADPDLVQLEADSKAYIESLKASALPPRDCIAKGRCPHAFADRANRKIG